MQNITPDCSGETVLPSEEKPWLRYFREGAREESLKTTGSDTIWTVFERRFREQGDSHPALRYFGKDVKRSEIIRKAGIWARTFRGMGIEADEHVIFFTPFTPEVVYMIFALNRIGACPVFLNMTAGAEALRESVKGCSHAVVLDSAEKDISHVLRDAGAFPTVIYLEAATCMPFPLRQLAGLASLSEKRKALASAGNYVTAKEAVKRWSGFEGEVDAEFKPGRHALITASSGTSISGYAKLIIDTNESVLAMFRQMEYVPSLTSRYRPGYTCFTSLPPFISTCMFTLFLAPLYWGCTCLLEPRFSIEGVKNGILNRKANINFTVGRVWMMVCRHLDEEMKKGRKPDMSFLRLCIMGGEGCSPKELTWINRILRECGSPVPVTSGYGLSEVFSVMSADYGSFEEDYMQGNPHGVITVGAPLPGVVVSIQDCDGNELPYGKRGELCVRATTCMEGYLHQEELTAEVFRGGWYHTGDLCELDRNGHIYHYCRMSDCFIHNGQKIYPVDLDIALRSHDDIQNAVMAVCTDADGGVRLYAHLFPEPEHRIDAGRLVEELDGIMSSVLPEGLLVEGYKLHDDPILLSPIGKSDRRLYSQDTEGFLSAGRQSCRS